MAMTINFSFEGHDYILEYTRKSIETMERQGFVAEDIAKKPMLMLPRMFHGAFLAHHRGITQEMTDKMLYKFGKRDELLTTLSKMYNEPMQALLNGDVDEEGDQGNVIDWKVGEN